MRYLTPNEYPLWDAFLSDSQGGNLYSSTTWLTAIKQTFGHATRILGLFEDGALSAGVAFNRRSLPLAGNLVVPAPLAAYTSAVVGRSHFNSVRRQESHYDYVLTGLSRVLETEYAGVDLVHHPDLIDMRPFQWRGWRDRTYYTYLIDLRDRNRLWRAVYGDVRTRVRKCARAGVEVTKDGDAETFYRLWSQTYARQGRRCPISHDALCQLFGNLQAKGCLVIYEAHLNSEPLSMIAVLRDAAGVIHEWQSATSTQHLEMGVFSFLMWSVIEDAASQNVEILDMNGAGVKGIAFSKNQFGGRLVPHYRVWHRSRRAEALYRARELLLVCRRGGAS